MKFVVVLLFANLIAHSGCNKSHFGFKHNYNRYKIINYQNHIDCYLCNYIVGSYFSNGEKIFILKMHKFLSKFDKKRITKKFRKHLGFHSKRVKFRFII